MKTALWILPAAAGLAALLPVTASALPAGMNGSCSGCHYGQTDGRSNPIPEVSLDVPKYSNLAPGEEVTFAFTVKATWPDAIAAGFNATFTDEQLNTQHLAPVDNRTKVLDVIVNSMQETPGNNSISHNGAQALDANRETTFQAKFIAPTEPGVYEILLQTVTTNSMDGIQEVTGEIDDPTRDDRVFFSVGCDMQIVYGDGDEDGIGSYFKKLGTCDLASELGNFSATAGDCNDSDAFVFPGSQACGFQDFDCDGTLDALTFYPDIDGDGAPERGATPKFPDNPMDCERPGMVAFIGVPEEQEYDCDATNPAIFPGAPELPNGIDDNCNMQVDEGAAPPVMPGGAPAPAPPNPVAVPNPVPGVPVASPPAVPPPVAVPGVAAPVPGVQPIDPATGLPTTVPVVMQTPTTTSGESGFGCSVSSSSKSPLSLFVALLGGAALILLRRRK